MKISKRFVAILLAGALVAGTIGACSSDSEETTTEANSETVATESVAEPEVEANTVATKLAVSFAALAETDSDVESIANALCEDAVFTDIAMGAIEVEPGYLNGFTDEVNGFTSGYMFAPMIGTMPFVGYVFISDDPDALSEELNSKADLRWNICTEADEMVSKTVGNLVFFCMAPNSFDA